MAAYESRGKMDERIELLKERREKLASLLESERQLYEVRSPLFHGLQDNYVAFHLCRMN